VLSSIVRLIRIASVSICLIVVASFIVFAADETKTASGRQQEQVAAPTQGGSSSAAARPPHKSSVHEALDEAANTFTSPFAGVVSSTSSEWASQGAKLIIALLVYGFGLGFIARTLRVRF
jgi:hypothetical protein